MPSQSPTPRAVRFESAGGDEDLRARYVSERIRKESERGTQLLLAARDLLLRDSGADIEAERDARASLEHFASALNWAEDGEWDGAAHANLDAAGSWTRSTFGCTLTEEDGQYFQTCPVRLGHNRVGLSIGGQAKRICSLCGDDLSDCPHMRGTAYMVPGGREELGWCRVCLSDDACNHTRGTRYRVGVVAIIREMQLDEVSIVFKPAHPDARISKISIASLELQAALGPA